MATHSSSSDSTDRDQLLDALRSDRLAMARRLTGPAWLAPGFGLVAAAYVATAAIPSDPWRDAVFIAAVVASVAMLTAYRKTTGVKLSRLGARATVILLSAMGVALVMLSVSYGLMASPFAGWVAASILMTFLAVTWLARLFIRAASERVNRGV